MSAGGVPPRLLLLLDFLEAIDRLARRELVELEELADLDLAVLALAERSRKPARPLERLFARLHLDERVASHELLRLRERPVQDRALPSRVPDAPALGARLPP